MAKKNNRQIERKIFFYKVTCFIDGNEIAINDIFDSYIQLLNADYNQLEERKLAIPYMEKLHFLDVLTRGLDYDVYYGKFYSLRSTDFPYLFNILNGSRQVISAREEDTLMEQTHFICFANKRLIVSEYNFYGARIEKLADYLEKIMTLIHPSKRYSISILPIIIPEYFKQIVNCTSISKIQFKAAHPGLKILMDENIIGVIDIAKDNLKETSEYYIDIEVSGGDRGKALPIHNIHDFLCSIVSAISKGNEYDLNKGDGKEDAFRKAKIKAYNPDQHKIIPYDLLDEKLVHTCYVEKLSDKSKYVDSEKMFDEIIKAYNNQKENAIKYMESI